MVQSYPKLTQDLKNMSQLLAANLLPTYWLLADHLLTDLLNHLLTSQYFGVLGKSRWLRWCRPYRMAQERCHSSIVKLTSFIGIKVLVNNIVTYAKGNNLLYALSLLLTCIYTVNFSIFIYSDHFFSFFLHFSQKNSGNSELSSLVPAAAELTRYGIPDRLHLLPVSNFVFSNFGVSPQVCFLKFFITLFCSAGNTIPWLFVKFGAKIQQNLNISMLVYFWVWSITRLRW